MKSARKILSLLLVVILIAVSCVFTSANAADATRLLSRNEIEWQSVKENTDLLNYFYELNPDKDYDGKYFPDYYGGSLIDSDGGLIVMLTDNSGKEVVNSFVHNVKFVSCEYSYSELVQTINSINAKFARLGADDVHKNLLVEMSLLDKDNVIEVVLRDNSNKTIKWFTENISNKPYLRFEKIQKEPGLDMNYSGQDISTSSGTLLSSAFRVKRYTDSGLKYGFITCAHGNSLFQTIKGADGSIIGTVQLRNHSGNMDASYVQMSSSSNYSNVMHGSPYTLNDENDDLFYPVYNQVVGIFARHHQNDYGVVNCTNYSHTVEGVTLSGIYKATYPRSGGDSGGLIASSPVNYHCNPGGIHRGYASNGNAVFTSATKVINYFYFMRY